MKGNILPSKALLRPVDDVKVKNGVIIPPTAKKLLKGEILLVGDGCEVEVGDVCTYSGSGIKVNIEDEDLVLINENQVLYYERN